MFRRILHANDGSDHAFHALTLALGLAQANKAELHMVCVKEVDYAPEFIEEVREESATAARRFHTVVQRARTLAEDAQVAFTSHVVAGHAVRDIVKLAADIKADLLVIGSTGHSEFYERMLGTTASRVVHLAACPVLVVK